MNEPQDLLRLLICCEHLGRQYGVTALRRRGCTVPPVQMRTLVYLDCCREEVKQRDLERELRLRPSTVNGIVSRLEEKGYIARRASPMDGRCRLVELTAAGREQVGAFRAALEETNSRFCAVLTDQEREQMGNMLSRIISDLENEVNKA